MGQTWTKFTSGHMEAGSNAPPAPEACSSPDPNSQASREASSSIPLHQGGPFSVAAADVELSSLKDEDEESDQERGKETQTTLTPTPSTSQHLSPKEPEKAKSSHGSRAFKQFRLHKVGARKFNRAQEESPSQFSPSQAPEKEVGLQVEEDEEETASQSMLPEPKDVELKVNSAKEGEVPPHSSQKMLFFELDRKRKAPAGLPSLAIEIMGSSRMRLKARAPAKKPSERGARKDLGAGEALVGRRVRKVEYDNGKEATEWLDLEQSKSSSAPVVEEAKGAKTVRKSLRNAAATKAKKMEEFVYTKRSVRGRRRKK